VPPSIPTDEPGGAPTGAAGGTVVGATGESSGGRGRLYRSAGAVGPQAAHALPALTRGRQARLSRRAERPGRSDRGGAAREERRTQREARRQSLHGEQAELGGYREEDDPLPPGSRGLALLGITVLIVLIPSVVGFVDVLLFTRVGLLTNATFAACVGLSALTARRGEIWTPVIAAPLGYLTMVLVSGQSTLGTGGGLLVREATMVATTLGLNAVWVLSTTAAALVIAAVRTLLSRRSVDPISGR